MTSPTPRPKSRAFSKWLDNGATPVAAVDQDGQLQFFNEAFGPFQAADDNLLPACLMPPAEAWTGFACQRIIDPPLLSPGDSPSSYDIANFLPLVDPQRNVFGCLITLDHSTSLASSTATSNDCQANKPVAPLSLAPSSSLQNELLQFRKRWTDTTQLDCLCGTSPQIRKTLQQVQLAIATNTPVLIRAQDTNAAHDLAKAIWLQRFKRSQTSSAGYQFMPLSARTLDGEMLRSALELSLPLKLHGEFLETTVLIEDLAKLHENAYAVLEDWLTSHRPPQIFATEITSNTAEPTPHRSAIIDQHLRVFAVEIPPLRERPEDIPAIATRILNHSAPIGKGITYAFSNSAIETLIAYPWNGDLTELRTMIQSIELPSARFLIEPNDLPLALRTYIGGKAVPTVPNTSLDLDQVLLELEKSLLEKTLQESRGNRALTARKLGISRARLLRRLAQLQIVAADTESGNEPELDVDNKEPIFTETEQPKTTAAADDFAAIDFVPLDDPSKK